MFLTVVLFKILAYKTSLFMETKRGCDISLHNKGRFGKIFGFSRPAFVIIENKKEYRLQPILC
ncbi:hypothetical protein, partial [Liquorilactobacillus mali]|uniref:hypothetical protein n=1 Tax=Liquorilactobacillus mali TaxID=1618 RepID=UPI0039E774EE